MAAGGDGHRAAACGINIGMAKKGPPLVPILILAAAALALGTLFLLPTREVVAPSSAEASPAAAPTPELSSLVDRLVPAVPPTTGIVTLESSPSGADWEDRLDNILSAEAENQTVVNQLLNGLPRLPVEAQEEFIAHALNLCDDENYAGVETIYLARGTPPEVSEEIFNDVLNRPDEIKLPLLAKTLRSPAHPMAGEAREILEMYLDLEEGAAPPAGWDAAVQQYLAEEQEE